MQAWCSDAHEPHPVGNNLLWLNIQIFNSNGDKDGDKRGDDKENTNSNNNIFSFQK